MVLPVVESDVVRGFMMDDLDVEGGILWSEHAFTEENIGGVGGPLVGAECVPESGVERPRATDDDAVAEFDGSVMSVCRLEEVDVTTG